MKLVRQQLLARDLHLGAVRNLRRTLGILVGDKHGFGDFRWDYRRGFEAAVGSLKDTITEQVSEGLRDVAARVVECSLEIFDDDDDLVEQHLAKVGLPALDTFHDRGSLDLQRLVAVAVHGKSKWVFDSVCEQAATVLMGTMRSWWVESEVWDPVHVSHLVTELVDEMYAWAEQPQTLQVWANPWGARPPAPLMDLDRRERVIAVAGCNLEGLYWNFLVPEDHE